MADEPRQTPSAMSDFLERHKIWAAFVMIAFLALLLAMWAMGAAGRRAVAKPPCAAADAQAKWTPLEVKPPTEGLSRRLGERAACQSRALAASLDADWLFLFSYGALNLFIFLFLATRVWTKRALIPLLVVSGALLTIAMVGGDILENAELRRWLGGAIPAPGPLQASVVKWLSLGAASAIAGAVYLGAPRWWGKIPVLPGIAALVLFVRGWRAEDAGCIEQAMAVLAVFWLVVLLHAVGASTVAVRPLEERSVR